VIGGASRRRSGDSETDLGSPQDGELRLGADERTLERGVRLGRARTRALEPGQVKLAPQRRVA
jgi:hypothetical protein